MKKLFSLLLCASTLFSANDYWCDLQKVSSGLALSLSKSQIEWAASVKGRFAFCSRVTSYVFDYEKKTAACVYVDLSNQYSIGYFRDGDTNKATIPGNDVIKPQPLCFGVSDALIFYLSISSGYDVKNLTCHILQVPSDKIGNFHSSFKECNLEVSEKDFSSLTRQGEIITSQVYHDGADSQHHRFYFTVANPITKKSEHFLLAIGKGKKPLSKGGFLKIVGVALLCAGLLFVVFKNQSLLKVLNRYLGL